jgi:hypothetical protein
MQWAPFMQMNRLFFVYRKAPLVQIMAEARNLIFEIDLRPFLSGSSYVIHMCALFFSKFFWHIFFSFASPFSRHWRVSLEQLVLELLARCSSCWADKKKAQCLCSWLPCQCLWSLLSCLSPEVSSKSWIKCRVGYFWTLLCVVILSSYVKKGEFFYPSNRILKSASLASDNIIWHFWFACFEPFGTYIRTFYVKYGTLRICNFVVPRISKRKSCRFVRMSTPVCNHNAWYHYHLISHE